MGISPQVGGSSARYIWDSRPPGAGPEVVIPRITVGAHVLFLPSGPG